MGLMSKRAVSIIFIITLIIFFFQVQFCYSQDPQVGVLMSGNTAYFREIHNAFTEALKSKGIKAEIALQTPAPDVMAWANAARKFVVLDMDAIVTYGTPVTQTVLSETSNIPVVFAGVYEGQEIKGKNATGVVSHVSVAGLLKNLKGIKNFSTLGIVYNSAEKATLDELSEVERLSGQFSFKPVKFNIKNRGDIQRIKDVDALFITSSCAVAVCINDIVQVAKKNKIPTAATMGGLDERGVLLTLFADPKSQGRAVAEILSRILQGESPSSIPQEDTKKIQLVVNLREATALGLTVPFDILSVATKVIK